MIHVVDLFDDPARRGYAAAPEMDALTDPDALQEAELVEFRGDVMESDVGLLFDLRGALQLRAANTAAIIVRGVRTFSWSPEHRPGRTAHIVVSSIPGIADGHFTLTLAFAPTGRLSLEATQAEFYVGEVPGLSEAPPDYLEDDTATLRAGMPSWRSNFEPVHATFLGFGPS